MVLNFHFSSEVIHTLEESWKIRESWWPQYHFTSDDCPETETGEECELCLCKAKYAAYVLGQGQFHLFICLFHTLACSILSFQMFWWEQS